MQNRQLLDSVFREAGTSPNIVVETDSVLALYAHVLSAGLFTIAPHSLLSLIEMRHELTAIPLHPPLHRQIGLVKPQQTYTPQLLKSAWNIAETLDLQERFDALISSTY
ncbi:LysR family transcriptional regulator substrate-binding protein [Methylicorpusculum oleiharenae]|nr:LysR family transcriptional regulator substrate-binding protein [Methylicorpusculum oleiharenae]